VNYVTNRKLLKATIKERRTKHYEREGGKRSEQNTHEEMYEEMGENRERNKKEQTNKHRQRTPWRNVLLKKLPVP
jgi:hypothetical protein